MDLQLWETLKEAIKSFTSLSPAALFTIAALFIAIYYVASALFGSSDHSNYQRARELEEESKPLPPPVQVGEISEEELKQYDGSDPNKPLLMAIKAQIYDVTQSRMFYGPGGPYALFAGKDASRALAKMSFEEKDLTGDISGLGPFELEALQDWEYKFMSKYVKVGTVKHQVAGSEEAAGATADGEASSEVTTEHDEAVKPGADVSSEIASKDGPPETVSQVKSTPPESIIATDGNADEKE
ncbi:unnamed protein product [Cuscuta europaea]|uniref:Cytochrome b5 heme-binding domain-containing protein n=1 Tax=Cuscuta europaea TaxID=41803 RepID=A0A9P1EKW3_CUSEU|nr:unnamed protein product [Cuscuta europaea]